jgi:MFS superfamily sulfate permease-like transporter
MLLFLVYLASRPHISVLGRIPGEPDAYGDVGRHPDYEPVAGILVLRLEAPMLYANASLVSTTVKRLAGAADPLPHAVIVDIGANSDLDITTAENLLDLARTLRSGGMTLGLAEVRQPVVDRARRTGVLDAIGEDHLFHTIDAAVKALGPPSRGGGSSAGALRP